MKKNIEELRNSIIKSKKDTLLKALKKDFYLACLSHLFIIFLTLMTLNGFTIYLISLPEVKSEYVLFIELVALLISGLILIIISSINVKLLFIKYQNLYSYTFIISCIISAVFFFYNTLIGFIILNILNKIWSGGDMGEKNNLYISFLLFIPIILLFLNKPWPYPIIGFLIHLLLMFVVKIIIFTKKYRQISKLDQHHLDNILSA